MPEHNRTPECARRDTDEEAIDASPLDIAIVGMACRFPGSNSLSEFWDNLKNGVSSVKPVPPERWSPTFAQSGMIRHGNAGLIEHPYRFDNELFDINGMEASCIDPQQRLALEAVYQALEDAGMTYGTAETDAGVFLGIGIHDYNVMQLREVDTVTPYTQTGVSHSVAANRISYCFNFTGPSLAVDTACSSSITAIHLAGRSLRSKECSVAVVGGVNLLLDPNTSVAFSKLGVLSPDGACKTFDESANGYVRGEGVGMLVLKPLEDARREGDRIHAVIKHTAINDDGGHRGGVSTPKEGTQVANLNKVYSSAFDASNLVYVEAHGTGTSVGDTVEANSICKAICARRSPDCGELLIGSVKTNVGHLECASGMSAIIKCVLQMKHRLIAPSLNFRAPNPNIPFSKFRLRVVTEPTPLDAEGVISMAVNNFGFGGANGHVVLVSYPESERSDNDRHPCLENLPTPIFTLSAKSVASVKLQLDILKQRLRETGDVSVADLALFMSKFRTQHSVRLAVAVSNIRDLRAHLSAPEKLSIRHVSSQRPKKIVFVFAGQGPQSLPMGRQLFKEQPIFRGALEEIDSLYSELTGASLVQMWLSEEPSMTEEDMQSPRHGQVAIFMVQMGLLAMWKAYGIVPDAVVGHSLGEVASFYAGGVITLREAVRVIVVRAQLQQKTHGSGRMLAVGLPVGEALKFCGPSVEVAAANSPTSTVLAGPEEELLSIENDLKSRLIFAKFLRGRCAFHSRFQDPIRDDSINLLAGVMSERRRCHTPVYSSVYGERLESDKDLASYWWENIREKVQFMSALRSIQADFPETDLAFVEISPHPVLSSSLSEMFPGQEVLHSIKRGGSEAHTLISQVGEVYAMGFVDSLYANTPRPPYQIFAERLSFLTYQLNHSRGDLINEGPFSQTFRLGGLDTSVLGHRVQKDDQGLEIWESRLEKGCHPALWEHVAWGSTVFPAVGYIAGCIEFCKSLSSPSDALTIESLEILNPLVLPENKPLFLRTKIEDKGAGLFTFHFSSRSIDGSNEFTSLATLTMIKLVRGSMIALEPTQDRSEDHQIYYSHAEVYSLLANVMTYGSSYRLINDAMVTSTSVVATVSCPEDDLTIGFLDCALQPAFFLIDSFTSKGLPIALTNVQIHSFLTEESEYRLVVTLVDQANPVMTFKANLTSFAGYPVAEFTFRIRLVKTLSKSFYDVDKMLYTLKWVEWSLAKPLTIHTNGYMVYGSGLIAEEIGKRLGAKNMPLVESLVGGVELDGTHQTVVLCLIDETSLERIFSSIKRMSVQTRLTVLYSGNTISSCAEGLGRTIKSECPDKSITLINVESRSNFDLIVDVILSSDEDSDFEFKVTATEVLVPRLALHGALSKPSPPALGSCGEKLGMRTLGDMASFSMRPDGRSPDIGAYEVEVRMAFTALNFKDVMCAMNLLPASYPLEELARFGIEGSGVVARMGEKVTRVKVGDNIACLSLHKGSGIFATYSVCHESETVVLPRAVCLREGAACFLAFVTAYIGLFELARIREGDSILVHGAAGGVGLAAVQMAQKAGATIYATAGTAKKRALLQETYGIEKVYNSRSLEFASEIQHDTHGSGVDIVFNSFLSGPEATQHNFSCLKAFGQYVDITIKEHYKSGSALSLRPFRNSASYHSIDLEAVRNATASRFSLTGCMDKIATMLETHQLKPLPTRVFEQDNIQEAFQYMSSPHHKGKIVVRMNTTTESHLDASNESIATPSSRNLFDCDGTYLVVGGLRGLGLSMADWMCSQGAHNIILVSRTDTTDDVSTLERLKRRHNIIHVKMDLTVRENVRDLFRSIHLPKLRGVFQFASQYNDIAYNGIEVRDFLLAVKTKGLITQYLHEETLHLGDSVDYFVAISSASCVLGNHHQASYASANSVMDSVIKTRRALGLPGLTISFGAIGERGEVARNISTKLLLNSKGLIPMSNDQVFDGMSRILSSVKSLHSSEIIFANVAWERVLANYPALEWNKLASLEIRASGRKPSNSIFSEEAVQSQIVGFLAENLRMNDIDVSVSLKHYGMDSLSSIQFGNWLKRTYHDDIVTQMELIKGPSVIDVMKRVIQVKGEGSKAVTSVINSSRTETSLSDTDAETWSLSSNGDNTEEKTDGECFSGICSSPEHSALEKPRIFKVDGLIENTQHQVTLLDDNNAFVLGIGTVTPPLVKQADIADALVKQLDATEEKKKWLHGLFLNAGIEQRGMAFDVLKRELNSLPDIEARNLLYKEYAPRLTAEAATIALEEWGGIRGEITHVISSSCTGVIVPDVNALMIDILGLSPNVERVSINYMGCFSGLTCLKTAQALAMLHPNNRVLVTCCELSSLHFQKNIERDDIAVGMAIFGDGCSAFVVGSKPKATETPLFEIISTATTIIPNTLEMMAWDMKQSGWDLFLGEGVPQAIFDHLPKFVSRLIQETVGLNTVKGDRVPQTPNKFNFFLHPGGKAILQSIQLSLELNDLQMLPSREILKTRGNMSGGSIIFSLKNLLNLGRSNKETPYCIGLTFGPGLSVEGAVLRWVEDAGLSGIPNNRRKRGLRASEETKHSHQKRVFA